MRKLILSAVMLILPCALLAQRGGGHAGGMGHASFAGPSGAHFSTGGAPRMFSPSARGTMPSYASRTSAPYRPGTRMTLPYRGDAGLRRDARTHRGGQNGYDRDRRSGIGYAGFVGYPFALYPGYPLDAGFSFDDNNDPNQQAGNTQNNNSEDGGVPYQDPSEQGPESAYGDAAYAGQGWEAARAPYNGAPALDASPSDGLAHPRLTLHFKDGHSLEVQNYVVTPTRIVVDDGGVVQTILLSSLQ